MDANNRLFYEPYQVLVSWLTQAAEETSRDVLSSSLQ
jgi:hypothetical protein